MTRLEDKLKRAPSVHNWIRNLGGDVNSTTKKLVTLAKGFPTQTYVAANPIIYDCVVAGLNRATALKAAATTGRQGSRKIVTEYVEAFYDWNDLRRYDGKPAFDEMIEPFRVGKGVTVPVKPLVSIVENGRLVPIFTVGWSTIPFNDFQKRLLATVLEDAVFSLIDFKMSPGEFLFFPKIGDGKEAVREAQIWRRGDMDLLTRSELRDCLNMYMEALDAARAILRDIASPDQKSEGRPDTTSAQFSLDF